jgi:hypothetical protein
MAPNTQLAAEQMTPAARDLLSSRHADLVQAASFYGYDLQAAGWTYKQSLSPIVQKHLILSFTQAEPAGRASHFVAVVPADSGERVQIVPSFTHGLRLFDPGWQKKGTYAVFNRLLKSEQGTGPITEASQWINYGSLYITLLGGAPAVPTVTDSVKATWDLSMKRATTPVIIVKRNGSAEIVFSDLSEPERTIRWTLDFDKQGQLQAAGQQTFTPEKVLTMQTAGSPAVAPLPAPSALNP